MQTHTLGKSGETQCVQYLIDRDYQILHKNYRSPYGEIDIIAKDKHHLVFIEVKTRTTSDLDKAKWDITYTKQKKITRTAMCFISDFVDPEIEEYRFDVMILVKSRNNTEIHHLINAFPPAEVGEFCV